MEKQLNPVQLKVINLSCDLIWWPRDIITTELGDMVTWYFKMYKIYGFIHHSNHLFKNKNPAEPDPALEARRIAKEEKKKRENRKVGF